MESSRSSKPAGATSARQRLADNMIALRRDRGWSQEALAFEAGLHRTFIAHVERRVRNIALDNLERIANALGVESYVLLLPPGNRTQSAQKLRPSKAATDSGEAGTSAMSSSGASG